MLPLPILSHFRRPPGGSSIGTPSTKPSSQGGNERSVLSATQGHCEWRPSGEQVLARHRGCRPLDPRPVWSQNREDSIDVRRSWYSVTRQPVTGALPAPHGRVCTLSPTLTCDPGPGKHSLNLATCGAECRPLPCTGSQWPCPPRGPGCPARHGVLTPAAAPNLNVVPVTDRYRTETDVVRAWRKGGCAEGCAEIGVCPRGDERGHLMGGLWGF